MVMAKIYTRCGRYGDAIATIDYLLSLGNYFTVNDFKLARDFEPLYGDPRFQAVMKKYALENSTI